MRAIVVVAAGMVIGWLPVTTLDNALPQTAIPYNAGALRSAIVDGMSRAGNATVVRVESPAPDARH